MNANAHEDLNQIAHAVIGAAFEVSNTLGAGFLEKVYERARVRQLQMHQLPEGLRTPPCLADQFPPAQSGMAADCARTLIRVHSRIFAAYQFTRPSRTRSVRRASGFVLTPQRLGKTDSCREIPF